MYTLSRAFHRQDPRRSRWVEFDAAKEPIASLLAEKGDVWLFITYPGYDGEKALRLKTVPRWINQYSTPSTTVEEWLTNLENRTLPWAETLPSFEDHYVRYVNAWHAGYQIDPIARDGTIEQGGSDYDKEDLRVWQDGLDPNHIARYCLFTVNGLFHPIDWGEDGVIIREGNTSLRHANDNQIGLYSFNEVGAVTYVPVTDEMVTPLREGEPLHKAVYLTLPDDVDTDGKTALLVVGGYLQALGSGYTRVGDRTWRVELQHLSLPERYFDSCTALDLSSLGLTEYEHNATLTSLKEFQSDATVRAYLTLPQTFFVVVDAESMFHEWEILEPCGGLPDRYLTYSYGYLPLVGAYGRALEYHAIEEPPYWVLATTPNRRHHYDFRTRPYNKGKAFDAGRYPALPTTRAHAYFRYLGTQR